MIFTLKTKMNLSNKLFVLDRFFLLYLIEYLLIHLGPRVLEGHCAVEYEVVGC